jgi:hypothetical protein
VLKIGVTGSQFASQFCVPALCNLRPGTNAQIPSDRGFKDWSSRVLWATSLALTADVDRCKLDTSRDRRIPFVKPAPPGPQTFAKSRLDVTGSPRSGSLFLTFRTRVSLADWSLYAGSVAASGDFAAGYPPALGSWERDHGSPSKLVEPGRYYPACCRCLLPQRGRD